MKRCHYAPELLAKWEREVKTNYWLVRDVYGSSSFSPRSRCMVTCRDKAPNIAYYQSYTGWDESVRMGRDYMVGSGVSIPTFMKTHARSMQLWQRFAYIWAMANPDKILEVESSRFEWQIYLRGEYVEFVLPHHDRGGEKAFISRTGKTMIWVNND